MTALGSFSTKPSLSHFLSWLNGNHRWQREYARFNPIIWMDPRAMPIHSIWLDGLDRNQIVYFFARRYNPPPTDRPKKINIYVLLELIENTLFSDENYKNITAARRTALKFFARNNRITNWKQKKASVKIMTKKEQLGRYRHRLKQTSSAKKNGHTRTFLSDLLPTLYWH